MVVPAKVCAAAVLGGMFLAATAHSRQVDPLADAVSALHAGRAAEAEQALRKELQVHPRNGEALAVLAVALDQQQKFSEAEKVYRQAIATEPQSAALRNNYGNHLLLEKQFERAQREFARAIALEPGNINARMQVAKLQLREKAAARAVATLDGLPVEAQRSSEGLLLRMQADYQLGRSAQAEAIFRQLSAESQNNLKATLALGSALFAAEQYQTAEDVFARAARLAPDSFDALYYLGLAASRSGEYDRAREFLEEAVRQQPDNVDALYDLAVVRAKSGKREVALQLAGQAARLAPDRPDVAQLLARLLAELGYFADSVSAWDRYLRLVPGDNAARRERAFVQTATESQQSEGLRVLSAYVRTHPADAIAHYELGTAECATDPEAALRELDRAVALDRAMVPARFARGLLEQRQGRTQEALADFAWAAKRLPSDAIALDRLGETQLEAGQAEKAIVTLRRASELAPENVSVLTHLGRALQKSGKSDEARAVFARVRELGPVRMESSHPAGLLEFLSLSPEQQMARYRAGVEASVKKNPENAQAQLQYMQLLLEEGQTEDAVSVARKLASLKPAPAIARQAESSLVAFQQYEAAKEFRADSYAQRN